MQLIAIALAAIIGIVVVAGAAWTALVRIRRNGPRKWVFMAGYALVSFGGLGFFGLAVSGLGGFRWLPPDLEWPVGAVHGALTMPDGTHVVPVKHAGNKIQIYSPDWRFLRGWYVPAGGGGQFELQLAGGDRIEVITRRPAMLCDAALAKSTPTDVSKMIPLLLSSRSTQRIFHRPVHVPNY